MCGATAYWRCPKCSVESYTEKILHLAQNDRRVCFLVILDYTCFPHPAKSDFISYNNNKRMNNYRRVFLFPYTGSIMRISKLIDKWRDLFMELMRAKYWQNVKIQAWAAVGTVLCAVMAVYNWMRTWEFAQSAAKLWKAVVLPIYIADRNSTYPEAVVRFITPLSAIILTLAWLVFVLYIQSYYAKSLKQKRLVPVLSRVLGIQFLLQAIVILGMSICDNQAMIINFGSGAPMATATIVEAAIFAIFGIGGLVVGFLFRNTQKKTVSQIAVSQG